MTSQQHPHDISPIPSSSKVDQNFSVLTETKHKSTDHKETSRDEFQSFVIVNDIDVEEELSKAQKDENRNFFKMLSMSFYGRVKSHSLDTQETRETNKYNMSPQARKAAFPRKASAHTPPDSKREALKGLKQKTQGNIKKTAPLIKDLPLTPEQFRRHLLTPKDTSIKMYSPVVVGKNCPGTMTSKDETKREVGFFREIQQRPQTVKAGSNRRADSGKKSGSSEKTQKDESPVKTNVFKLSRYPQKVGIGEQTEEKVQLTNVEPSGLDIKVEGEKDSVSNNRDVSSDNLLLKDVKLVRKQTSRRENNEGKSASTNNSGRSLPSSCGKAGLKETPEVKRFVLDQDSRPGTASGYAKYSTSSKGTEGKSRKYAKQKASSQESKHSSEDKFKRLEIMDLQDSDNEDKRYRRDVYTRQNTTSTGKDKQYSLRLDRQRSPIPAKMQERVPAAYNGGIGSWGKAMLIPSTDVTPKQEKRKESGSLEGKKSSSQSKEPKKVGKVKADSTEKLGKMELLGQWPGKTGEWLEQERNAFTPKYDMLRQKGKEKTWKLFEMYGKPKEKKEKERPSSPGVGVGMEENHKHFDLLELLSQKRTEKI